MNRFLYALLAIIMISSATFAQDKNFAKHTVAKGETITQIATKYNVTPYDIYKLNPDSQNGIKESDILLIPTSVIKTASASKPKSADNRTHVAKPKETLYSIARDYNVSIQDLKSLNAEAFASGLKIGQTIKIPNISGDAPTTTKENPKETVVEKPTSPVVSQSNKENNVFHIVEPKETKFGIAKKYGMTVQQLEEKNPQIVSNLPVGYKLIINGVASKPEPTKPVEKPITEKPIAEKPKPVTTEIVGDEIVTTETIHTLTKNGYANYEVKQGETMYSLGQYFNISPEELIKLNPTLSDGVKTGMILKVPGKGTIKTDVGGTPKYADSSKPIVKNAIKKQLVLLLPFNAAKIQSDTLKTMEVRLKKDAFLNMTLDFYSGALMAIDSAKTLGLNVDVRIFDSEESKMSSNIENVIKKNNVETADAVIGPFYQQYVEKAAELLNEKNVPVISPLSKEIGKSFPNLFQSMPPSDFGKTAMFNFMMSKKGNIIVVSDPKKVYNKDFITKNYPSAKFVTLLDNGALDVDNLKSQFIKDAINYVVLDSERTGLILGTTNILLNEMSNFQIQLVIIEPNDTLDFEEISMKRLTILKMLYPSLTRENNTVAATDFEKNYKEINKVFPSQFAIRGFDVTFDTLLRITQEKSFMASAAELKSEQIESKFEYTKKGADGYVNKGIYIMEYQDDLSVKQVN
ncbi:LysM peptidoglycan-binding domain-containing protein [Flavobacterium sp.]|uniref:amino acid ABC transporter substrate-binding protein n=1 Tax=Flavobacterium sp. TaxID=239 RepID=UPI00286ADD4A|nr:LysM peptidoglycan-binding domain-containing protein [Flavobacterium sp.]